MADRSWATTPDLEVLIVKALANGADDWTMSTEARTRSFLSEKERLQGEVSFIPIIHSFIVLHLICCLFLSIFILYYLTLFNLCCLHHLCCTAVVTSVVTLPFHSTFTNLLVFIRFAALVSPLNMQFVFNPSKAATVNSPGRKLLFETFICLSLYITRLCVLFLVSTVTASMKEGTFVLMAGVLQTQMRAVATAFAISSALVVTCAHNITPAMGHYAVASAVSVKGTTIGFTKICSVRVTPYFSADADWYILEAITDAGAPNPTAFPRFLNFAAHDHLPTIEGTHSYVRVPHAPVRRLNACIKTRLTVEATGPRRVLSYEYEYENDGVPTSMVFEVAPLTVPLVDEWLDPAAKFVTLEGDLSGGSSGSPYCCDGDLVCAMHLQSISDSVTIAEAIAGVKKRAKKSITITEGEEADPEMENATETYGGLSLGVVLVRDESFVRAIRALAHVDLNATISPCC
jgi:hypothetical protein